MAEANLDGCGDSNLKKGKQKCKLWLGQEADGLADTSTNSVSDMTDEIERLEKVSRSTFDSLLLKTAFICCTR